LAKVHDGFSAATRLIGSLRDFRYGVAFRVEVQSDHNLSLVVTTQARGSWSFDMDYAKSADVVASMVDTSPNKLALGPQDLLLRGALSDGLLGAVTVLAFTGTVSTGQPIVGALIFPVSLVMIVLLSLKLVTGSFALAPLARLEDKARWGAVIANCSWVFVANLLGSIAFEVLIAISLTNMGKVDVTGVAARFDWWVGKQIPVTLGNLGGGFVFTGLALYTTFKPAQHTAPPPSVAAAAE
jgi:formate/nitrite transporter FocA (FNT family)